MNYTAIQTIIRLQKESDITSFNMAKRAGISPNTVYNWLNGINPTADRWVKCIEAMGYEVKIQKKEDNTLADV
jgi:predicted transcriptional regulator